MSDELAWTRRNKGENNWRARNAPGDGTYVVYILDSFGTTTIYGVLIRDNAPGDGSAGRVGLYASIAGVGSVAEAKDAAQEHHYAACRANRWRVYMRDNEPPTHTDRP